MNEEQKKEFQELCYACKQEDVWRAGILHTMREINDNLKIIATGMKPLNDLVDSCDSRLQAIESNTGRSYD